VLTTIGWILARYVIPGNRIKFARNIVKNLELSGSETILEVGSGRGLYAIEIAKLLKTGRVTAIDVWEPPKSMNFYYHKLSQPTGNTIYNAKRNAEIEGVDKKIDFINMNGNSMKFESRSFDIVLGAFVVGHQGMYGLNMLKEMNRVLKPGGRIVLIDNFRDFTYFLLATPHLFVLSYLRGKKAKILAKDNWKKMINKANLKIRQIKTKKSIIVIDSTT
jgi:ubiquinone/menaquinone biosynthesis C-methylase UbiE